MDVNEFSNDFGFVDIGRESIPCLGNINNFECGVRESLGLLHTSRINILKDIISESVPCAENSNNLEDFFGVRSKSMLCTDTDHTFSTQTLHHSLNIQHSKFNQLRIQSLPAVLEQTEAHVEDRQKTEHKSESEEDDFKKLAFVLEAEHLASRIADESILETHCGEVCLLDSISQPVWEEILEEIQESPVQKTENVFKLVDKLIPTAKETDDSITNNLQTESVKSSVIQENSVCDFNNKTDISPVSSTGTSSLSRNEFLQNLSNVFDLQRLSVSQALQCSDKSKSSRDVKEILRDLSKIFKTENRSSEQQAEGQNLIMCLADMLCVEKSKTEDFSEDSGRSSAETDDVQKCRPDIDRCLSQSFSFLENKREPPKMNRNLNESKEVSKKGDSKRNRSMSVSSMSSIDKKNFKKLPVGRSSMPGSHLSKPSSLGKLKPRRSEVIMGSKRGPMKAVIPVGRMSKVKRPGESTKAITPPKAQVPPKKKCTSTPIEESKLHPMAQSTPDNPSNGQQSPKSSMQTAQRKFDYSVSPLSRLNASSNMSVNKINHSGSEPNLPEKSETMPSKIHRGKSSNDLKNEERPMGLKRSNSIGQENPALRARERANILKASNTSKIAVHKSRESLSEKSVLKSNRNIKSFNLMSKLRANGKENAGH